MRALITAAPAYATPARHEISRCLPTTRLTELAPGTFLAEGPGPFRGLAPALAATTFPRHVCPVQVDRPLDDATGWGEMLADALAPLGGGDGPVQVQVRCLPGASAPPVATLLASARRVLEGAHTQLTGGPAPEVISVVWAPGRLLVGRAPTSQQRSPWPGGEIRLRRDPGEAARSARKLEEALLLFDIPLSPGMAALDLGAAPGGWTGLLVGRGLQVDAVDTAALAPEIASHPGLTFHRRTVQSFVPPRGRFDLICADLSWDPLLAAESVRRFFPSLRRGGWALHTIKFFGHDPLDAIERVRAILVGGGLRLLAVRHLFHNRAEATAYLRAPD